MLVALELVGLLRQFARTGTLTVITFESCAGCSKCALCEEAYLMCHQYGIKFCGWKNNDCKLQFIRNRVAAIVFKACMS